MSKPIKCVVWDLDETLWHGILAENGATALRPGVAEAVRVFDERGILQSIASRNEADGTLAKLEAFGLRDYFLYPQIHWGAKSQSVTQIAQALNLGVDSFAFIDDQEFEREEVRHALPQVRCFEPAQLAELLALPAANPAVVTEDARFRRQRYLEDMQRREQEDSFAGPPEEFLRTLGMRFTIAPATPADLDRAEELTVRTNQLNSTGVTYSRDELARFLESPDHLLLTARLTDRFGTYGTIGLSLLDLSPTVWHLRLLLVSCRVMSRGVGSVLMLYLLKQAQAASVQFLADFIRTDRNRIMFVTYKFNGFQVREKDGARYLFEHPLTRLPDYPDYVELVAARVGEPAQLKV